MKWNKNIFTGFLWIATYIVSSITLAALAAAFLDNAGLQRQEFRILFLCLLFVVEIVLFFLIRSLIQYFRPKEKKSGKIVYVFCLLFLIALAIVVRVGFISMSGNRLAGDTSLFDVAKVTQGGIPLLKHNGTTLYVGLLTTLFSFVGNNPESVIYLQMVMQCLTIVFFFFFMRKSIGRVAALVTGAVLSFAPNFVFGLNVLSPGLLICFLTGAVLWLYSGVLEYTANQNRCGVLCVLHFLLTGAFLGGVAYLDVTGVVVMLIALIGVLAMRFACGIGGKILQFFVFVIGMCGGLAGLFYMEASLSGGDFCGITCGYFMDLFRPIQIRFPAITLDETGLTIMCLMVLVTFGMLGFFLQKYDKGIIPTLLFLAMTALWVLNQLVINENDLWMISFALVCGASVQYFADLWCHEDASPRLIVQNTELEEEEELQEELEEEETTEDYDSVKEESSENCDSEKAKEPSEDCNSEKEEEKEKPIQFIPNPLPVPKKHVHKELDYAKEVDADDLKFDVEIDDTDDFDIQ